MVSEFRGYNDVLPGAADRILTMAEKAQDSLIRLNEQDGRTTRKAYLASNFATAYFPWFALGATVVLAIVGADKFAWVAGVVAAISGGPQVVITIRDAFKRNDGQAEDDGRE